MSMRPNESTRAPFSLTRSMNVTPAAFASTGGMLDSIRAKRSALPPSVMPRPLGVTGRNITTDKRGWSMKASQ